MNHLKHFIPFCCAVALLCVAQAQESKLELLRGDFEVRKEALHDPVKAFQVRYVEQLEALKEKAQAKGDLDQVLAISNEVKMVSLGGSKIPEKYLALVRVRELYDKHFEKLAKERALKLRTILKKYRGELFSLQTSLTKAGQLEEAVAVKGEINQVDELLETDLLDASSASGSSSQGNTIPGQLVIYGTSENGNPMVLTEEQKTTPHIRVAAGHDRWLALRADGKTSHPMTNSEHYNAPKGTKDVVDIQAGRHMDIITLKSGEIISLGGSNHTKWVPKGLKSTDLLRISCGHSMNGYLRKDGTFIPFGYNFFNESASFPREDLLQNVADFSAGAGNYVFIKRDGSMHLTSWKGKESSSTRPEGLKAEDILSMESGLSNGAVLLTKKGKVLTWKTDKAPDNLPKIKQIRVGSGGKAAGQLADGTWIVWSRKEGIAEAMNAELKKLGPLKDLALGYRFFIAIK